MRSVRKTIWVVVGGLALGGLIVLAMRPRAAPVGARLAEALEREGMGLRRAAMLVDYVPDAAGARRVDAEAWRSGFGLEPGIGALETAGSERRWMAGRDFAFSWQAGAVPSSLGGRLDDAGVERALRRALGSAGYIFDRPRELVAGARAELHGLSDGELFMRWLRADRGVLVRAGEAEGATREAMLLVLPGPPAAPTGPILTFMRGDVRVYVWSLPGDGEACEVIGFGPQGNERWEGVLRVHGGAVAAERVRLIAYAVAGRVDGEVGSRDKVTR